MSTETDIVEMLRHTAGHLINGTVEDGAVETAMLYDAADLITKLRAERDAAARDMQERCATICDSWIGAHQHFQPKITSPQVWAIAGIEDIAEAIRALPTSVIATQREGVRHE